MQNIYKPHADTMTLNPVNAFMKSVPPTAMRDNLEEKLEVVHLLYES